MNKLEKIRVKAKEQANRTGLPLAIYNFNSYSPLYVIRNVIPGDEKHREFVEQINPD